LEDAHSRGIRKYREAREVKTASEISTEVIITIGKIVSFRYSLQSCT
jgi:hypothetical protein